jgi:hypothetical protein
MMRHSARMEQKSNAVQSSIGEKLATTNALAKRYAISPRQVQKMTEQGVFPAVRIARRCLRYDLAACDAAMDKFSTRAACLGRKGGQE